MIRFAIRVPVTNRVASVSAIVEAAQLAERLGFYGITVQDRLISDGSRIACGARDAVGEGDDRDVYEALLTLGFLAARTTRIRLLTSVVILPLREVILLAKQVAVLDVLSGGRVILGVGVGQPAALSSAGRVVDSHHSVNASKEYATLRVPAGRGRIADEYIQAMRAIWTSPRSSFSGDFVQFEDIQVFPKPIQKGGPPILVGGSSRAALRRVARHGEGWLPNKLRPEQYRETLAELGRLSTAAGRSPSFNGLNAFTCVASTDAEAIEVFRPTVQKLFAEPDLFDVNLVGTPSSVVARLKEYEAAGVNLVELKPIYRSVPDLFRMMKLIASEIMPAFEV